MVPKIALVAFVVTLCLCVSVADDWKDTRDVQNKLREIFGLEDGNSENVARDLGESKQKRLLRPTKALRERIRKEQENTLSKRLAFPDPFYNRYLDENQISGTCIHGGIVFQGGMTIHTTGCRQECYCPMGGGRAICEPLKCGTPMCVNAVQEQGMCCPLCMSGDNCLADSLGEKHIIPAGSHVMLPHGRCDKFCMCPAEDTYIEFGRETEAICSPLC